MTKHITWTWKSALFQSTARKCVYNMVACSIYNIKTSFWICEAAIGKHLVIHVKVVKESFYVTLLTELVCITLFFCVSFIVISHVSPLAADPATGKHICACFYPGILAHLHNEERLWTNVSSVRSSLTEGAHQQVWSRHQSDLRFHLLQHNWPLQVFVLFLPKA